MNEIEAKKKYIELAKKLAKQTVEGQKQQGFFTVKTDHAPVEELMKTVFQLQYISQQLFLFDVDLNIEGLDEIGIIDKARSKIVAVEEYALKF